jgi:glycosyltransferase involved in cell wall biosynthesis
MVDKVAGPIADPIAGPIANPIKPAKPDKHPMDPGPLRCQACPVAPGVPCPAHWEWEGWCWNVGREARQAARLRQRQPIGTVGLPDAVGSPAKSDAGSPAASPGHWTARILAMASSHPRRPGPTFPDAALPDGRVRVGIVSPCCHLGGAEKWISDLLDYCDPVGSRLRWEGIAIQFAPFPGAPTLLGDWEAHCPVRTGYEAIRGLAARVDVLVTWGILEVPWGISPEKLAGMVPDGLPIITVSHGASEYPEMDPDSPSGKLAGRAIPIAVSRPAIRQFARDIRPRARVILNGVADGRVAVAGGKGRGRQGGVEEDRKAAREAIRESWGLPKGVDRFGAKGSKAGPKVAGWLGRLSHEKRPELFVDAIANLPRTWFGVMAGAGAAEASLREQAGRLGLLGSDSDGLPSPASRPRLIFLGARDDIGDILAGYDCLVMTSDTEACSLAAGEAWLAGVPLISRPVGLLEDHPELARIIPFEADGPAIAKAIVGDYKATQGTARRVASAKLFANTSLGMERFAADWTETIIGAAGPIPGPDLCDCGDGVWVGSWKACIEQAGKFDRVIHIYRNDIKQCICEPISSRWEQGGSGQHLGEFLVRWQELQPFEEMEPGLDAVMEYARRPGRLMLHCAGGVCRSPTLALAAKLARGCPPERAKADIIRAFRRDRGIGMGWLDSPGGTVGKVTEAARRWIREKDGALPGGASPGEATHVDGLPKSGGGLSRVRSIDPAVRDAIAGCVHRGREGSLKLLSEEMGCCGGGQELTPCAAGMGKRPGRVTLAECMECAGKPPGPLTPSPAASPTTQSGPPSEDNPLPSDPPVQLTGPEPQAIG